MFCRKTPKIRATKQTICFLIKGEKILEMLREDGSAKVGDLARIFKVTEVTIRQDLEKLEKEEMVIREHGGAYLKNIEDQVKGFYVAHQELHNMQKEKDRHQMPGVHRKRRYHYSRLRFYRYRDRPQIKRVQKPYGDHQRPQHCHDAGHRTQVLKW